MFNLNNQGLFLMNTAPEVVASALKRLASGVMNVAPGLNENVDSTNYYDGEGFAASDVTGAQLVYVYTGHRNYSDEAQNYVFDNMLELGDGRKTDVEVYSPLGEKISGEITIANISPPSGDSAAKGAIGFEWRFNGKPDRVAKSAAEDLDPTVAGGSASGMTAATATPGTGNSLFYKLFAANPGTYYNWQYKPSGFTAYTSGDDIVAAAGQFLVVLEVSDDYKRVIKASTKELASGDITA